MEDWESDSIVEQWIRDNDETFMPLPTIEAHPHLLISKVRKHYMEYLIKLLSVNYESNQKQYNKNFYLPSAIWRCAKMIEMSAAQASMVVQLYRKNITNVVKDLKNNTKEGLLYKKLYECLHHVPENEKKTQTTLSKANDCKCTCNQRNTRKCFDSSKNIYSIINNSTTAIKNQNDECTSINQNYLLTPINSTTQLKSETLTNIKDDQSPEKLNERITNDLKNSDELMLQLEKLFQDDPTDDDLFDGALCEADNSKVAGDKKQQNVLCIQKAEPVKKDFQNACFDDKLALFSGVLLNNTDNSFQDSVNQNKKNRTSKWLCEEYFQKVKLYELLDHIRDCDRNKLARIKEMLLELFGEDSDDEGVVSPLEESTEFVLSCKERIAPWVVKILTPYYVKGRIRGKALFKSLAKHLIKLIYQCSKYPREFEVQSFVYDFLNNHKMIRCEADFKKFKIENF